MEESNTIKNGNTFKIGITFEIDVPHTYYESNFNTIILSLHQINEMDRYECTSEVDLKIKNEMLSQIQQLAELLKYREV